MKNAFFKQQYADSTVERWRQTVHDFVELRTNYASTFSNSFTDDRIRCIQHEIRTNDEFYYANFIMTGLPSNCL